MKRFRLGQSGFTITELVIVMPIVSLILLGLIGFMVSQYASLHSENARANLQLEAETMLLDLEDELLFTTDFAPTKSSDLNDEHAPSGGWSHNTNPDTLIIYETALTAPRRNPDSDFVYKRVHGCSSNFNPLAINNLIYFTTDNPNDEYRTLYRRTLIPEYDTCNTTIKDKTCPAAHVGTNNCTAADSVLSEKIKNFQVEYFDEDNVPTSNPLAAEKIKVSVVLGQRQFGKEITVDSSITMKKIN